MEEEELEVDWEGMYNEAVSTFVRYLLEGKYKEWNEEKKTIRMIPLEERVKMVQKRSKLIGNIRGVTNVEAVRKYVKNEKEIEKCLKILNDIRGGKMTIKYRDEYCTGEYWTIDKEKINDPLLKAAKQAIEANDLPSLITLSEGCFLPSDYSIRLDLEDRVCSLFEYSCMIHAVDCALYLLEAGGGIEQKFKEGSRPLHQSLRGGNEEIGMFLIERGADITAIGECESRVLHTASFGNCFEIAKLLIERGADIEAKDKDEKTPLYYAADRNNYEVAQLLIEKGADIEAKNELGWTPLHCAAYVNSYEIAQLLIERGADIEAKDSDGETPLHKAAFRNSYEVAQLLTEKGADIEAKDNDRKTPLHKAAFWNKFDVIKLLIEKGVDIEVKDKIGRTPLHCAAYVNSYEVAQLLIERGADIKAKDKTGRVPLQLTNSDKTRKLITEAAKRK